MYCRSNQITMNINLHHMKYFISTCSKDTQFALIEVQIVVNQTRDYLLGNSSAYHLIDFSSGSK